MYFFIHCLTKVHQAGTGDAERTWSLLAYLCMAGYLHVQASVQKQESLVERIKGPEHMGNQRKGDGGRDLPK